MEAHVSLTFDLFGQNANDTFSAARAAGFTMAPSAAISPRSSQQFDFRRLQAL